MSRFINKFSKASEISFLRDNTGKLSGRIFSKFGDDDDFVIIDNDEVADIKRLQVRPFDTGEKINIQEQMDDIKADKEETGDILQSVYFMPRKDQDARKQAFGEIGEVLVERKLDNFITRAEDRFNITDKFLYRKIVSTSFFDFVSKRLGHKNNFIVEVKRKSEEIDNYYLFSNMTKLIKWAYSSIRENGQILYSNMSKHDINTNEAELTNFSKYDFVLLLKTPNNLYYHKFNKKLVFSYIKGNRMLRNDRIYNGIHKVLPSRHLTINKIKDMKWVIQKSELTKFTEKSFIENIVLDKQKEKVEEIPIHINITKSDAKKDIEDSFAEEEIIESKEIIVSRTITDIFNQAFIEINRKKKEKENIINQQLELKRQKRLTEANTNKQLEDNFINILKKEKQKQKQEEKKQIRLSTDNIKKVAEKRHKENKELLALENKKNIKSTNKLLTQKMSNIIIDEFTKLDRFFVGVNNTSSKETINNADEEIKDYILTIRRMVGDKNIPAIDIFNRLNSKALEKTDDFYDNIKAYFKDINFKGNKMVTVIDRDETLELLNIDILDIQDEDINSFLKENINKIFSSLFSDTRNKLKQVRISFINLRLLNEHVSVKGGNIFTLLIQNLDKINLFTMDITKNKFLRLAEALAATNIIIHSGIIASIGETQKQIKKNKPLLKKRNDLLKKIEKMPADTNIANLDFDEMLKGKKKKQKKKKKKGRRGRK